MISNTYLKEYKTNLILALPIVASQVGHIAVGIADSIMVGSLGGESLAAVTVAFSVYIPFMMLGIGISYGVTPLVAKSHGEKNHHDIASLLKHSTLLNALIGILVCLSLYTLSSYIIYLEQPSKVVQLAIPFFELLAISTIPLMLFQSFRQFAEGLSLTFPAMIISISGNVLNIVLNYIFIKGESFGIVSLGVNGAGYATLIARIVMAIGMFAYVYYHQNFKQYWLHLRGIKYSFKELARMVKMSLPVGIQLSLESGAFGFAAIMIGWLGANELAAHHVALNMAATTYMAASGIAAAATVRVGNEFGRKDYRGIRIAGMGAFHLVLVFMSLTAIGFILLRHILPQFYINEEQIKSIAVKLLLISAYFQLSDGLQVVGLGTLRGLGDVRIPTAIALVAYWLIGLPVGYIMAFNLKLGVEGIWYGLLIGLTVAAIFLFYRFNSKSNKLLRLN